MIKNGMHKLSIVFVLIVAIILSGCNSDKTDSYDYESEEAALNAYLESDEIVSENAKAAGSFFGNDGKYYLIQATADNDELIVHIAIIKEKNGKYSCQKYSPDYSSEAVAPKDGECRYFSIPFEEKYLNIGMLDSDKYMVNVDGKNLKYMTMESSIMLMKVMM